jgi:hypothetical protein
MQDMTIKELKMLTMKDIKAYVLMKSPGAKAPKKWQDKTKCLAWAEKALDGNAELKKSTVKKGSKIPKAKARRVKKASGDRLGKLRRLTIVTSLRTQPSTALELAKEFGVKYKTVLDDIHAIRHERAETVYMKDGEVLSDVRLGKTKAFFICKKENELKKKQSVLNGIELV